MGRDNCARHCSRARCRNTWPGPETGTGVDAGVVPADAEEQVRSCGSARRADQADNVALLDLLPRLHIDLERWKDMVMRPSPWSMNTALPSKNKSSATITVPSATAKTVVPSGVR